MKIFKSILTSILLLSIISCSQTIENEDEHTATELAKMKHDSLLIVFDSIMEIKVEIPQLIDSSLISVECLDQFSLLARETKGELKIVANSKYISKVISEIIAQNSEDNTDIMIIIDKTSSMSDDIENIQLGLHQIIEAIDQKENVRLAISMYGDRNVDGNMWYDFKNFESDFTKTSNFINNIQLSGGGDYPESVYDGIYEAFQEGFWKSNSKRIVILLGDAPSLVDDLSIHTSDEIVALAKGDNVFMNFYPIVISPYNNILEEDHMKNLSLIESVFPNPTTGPLKIRMNNDDVYGVEIFNQNGVLVQSNTFISDQYNCDLSKFDNGMYIVRMSDELKNYDTRKVILNK